MGLTDRVKRAWNAFQAEEQARPDFTVHEGMTYTSRPDRPMLHLGNEKSVIGAIYNRIALDVASVDIKHVRLDQNGVFKEILQTGLNECLTIDANVDQTGRALIFDIVLSMFDEGCIAVVCHGQLHRHRRYQQESEAPQEEERAEDRQRFRDDGRVYCVQDA